MRRLAILLGALVCVPVAPAFAAQRPDGQLKAQLLPAHPARKAAEPGPRVHRLRTRSPQELASAKRAAGYGIFAAPLPGQAPTPNAVVTGGLNQPGIAAADNSAANQGTPPDPTGAIGPNDYVEFVNSKVAVYSRSDLSLVGSMADLDAFVGVPGDDVFDPQIQWDPQSSRWFYLADDAASSTSNFLVFGFSKTSDPSDLGAGGWCRYRISIGTPFDDYPKLGHDDNHVLFGTNVFSNNSTGGFVGARIWSIPKPAAGTLTSCPTFSASFFGGPANPLLTADGNQVFTPVPADTTDSLSAGYVVAADYPGSSHSANQIMAWHVGGTAGSPTLVPDGNMTVTSYAFPANVPQPGVSGLIDSSDTRLTQAVAHADSDASGAEAVWTQHTVDGTGGRSVVRWYELLPASTTVRQEGTVQSDTDFVFNGAVSPAMDGTSAVVQYNTGSATDLTQIRAQSRVSSDAVGTTDGEVTLGTSAAADQDFSCGGPTVPCRWGDYAALTPDPANSTQVWGSNQLIDVAGGLSDTDPHWITRNFALDPWPDTIIDSGPSGPTNSSSPSFDFHADEAGSTFECKLDGPGATTGAWAACSSPQAYSGLADGDYTFSVRATDPLSHTDPTPATRSFTVDTQPPAAPSIASPANGAFINASSVTLSGTAEKSSTVEVFDGATSEGTTAADGSGNWSKSLTVADGSHTYTATATDAAGNTSAASSATTVAVDALLNTSITAGPSGPTNDRSPSFSFTSTEASPNFLCELDGPGAATTETLGPCTSPHPYPSLADGAYTFKVQALHQSASNPDPTPATRSFTVDTHAPAAPSITSPANGSTNTTGNVTVAGTAEASSIVEIFDSGASQGTTVADGSGNWSKSLTGVANGAHTYTATATDAAGNTSGLSSATTITVDVAAPPPPPPPLSADVAPPRLTLTFARTQKLRTVLRRGIAGTARCNEACTVRFTVLLPRRTAKQLHIAARYVTIGKLTKRLAANRTTSVLINLTRKARKQLAHIRTIKLRLTIRASDASGNTSKTIIRSITLKP